LFYNYTGGDDSDKSVKQITQRLSSRPLSVTTSESDNNEDVTSMTIGTVLASNNITFVN
jgi:hypothetical protein